MNCVKTTAITVSGNTLILILPDIALNNADRLRVCIAQKVPKITETSQVCIMVNKKLYYVITRCVPNYLYTDQLKQCCNGDVKSRQTIDVVFAPDSSLFMYDGYRLPCTKKDMPTIEPKTLSSEEIG